MEVYTDGSMAEKGAVAEWFRGKLTRKLGGAIVLHMKGGKFKGFKVEIRGGSGSAFTAELVSLVVAIGFARKGGARKDLPFFSDCQSAISTVNLWCNGGTVGGDLMEILSSVEKTGVVIHKVKAHPERNKEVKEWKPKEVGIWIADMIAGGELVPNGGVIDAGSIIRDRREDGIPIIINEGGMERTRPVEDLVSCGRMEEYLVTRDGYRKKEGKMAIWEGSYGGMGVRLMRRRKGIEESAVIQRIMYDKRWTWKRNEWNKEDEPCEWCGTCSGSRGHVLFKCRHTEVSGKRSEWEEKVWTYVGKMNKDWRKDVVEDVAMDVFRGQNEMLACGVIGKSWGLGRKWALRLVDKAKMRVVEEGLKLVLGGGQGMCS